jgi:hypothetical protein
VPNGNTAQTTNPVLAYEMKYEAEHPKDYSFEGTLARISGMTKDDIAFLIEMTKYSNFLANYDPSTHYSFSESKEEPVFLQKCPICGRIFKTKILAQDFCDDCMGDLYKDCLS